MNAMIFAAGLGTRLRPLTNDRPKAMVEVAGKPLLWHCIVKLRAAGFDHVVVNVHHYGEQIIDYLQANDNFGIDIRVSDERQLLLDTGGGIKHALPLFANDDPVLIHNVDVVSDIDLRTLYEQHRQHVATCAAHGKVCGATLAVNQRQTQRYLLFDDQQNLSGWVNLKTGETKPQGLGAEAVERGRRFAFTGIHVIDPQLYGSLAQYPAEVFSIIDFYLHSCRAFSLVGEDVTGHRWVDCGKPETLPLAAEVLKY